MSYRNEFGYNDYGDEYPMPEKPDTWNCHFRTALERYPWMRVLYAWHSILERDGLTIIALAGATKSDPEGLLNEMIAYNKEHPGRIGLFMCGTTHLPVFKLNYNHGEMAWFPHDDGFDDGEPMDWNPMALDLTRYFIIHYWPKLKTYAAKQAFDPYGDWIGEYEGYAQDDTALEDGEWEVMTNVAKKVPKEYNLEHIIGR